MSRRSREETAKVIEVLADGGAMRPGEVVAAADLGRKTVMGILRSLQAQGEVVSATSPKGTKYRLA